MAGSVTTAPAFLIVSGCRAVVKGVVELHQPGRMKRKALENKDLAA
jgi:hypothetical protein